MPYLTAKSSSKETKYDLYAPETIDASGYPDGGWFRRLHFSGAGKTLDAPLTRGFETHPSLEAGQIRPRLTSFWAIPRLVYVAPPLEPQEYTSGGFQPYRLARLAFMMKVTLDKDNRKLDIKFTGKVPETGDTGEGPYLMFRSRFNGHQIPIEAIRLPGAGSGWSRGYGGYDGDDLFKISIFNSTASNVKIESGAGVYDPPRELQKFYLVYGVNGKKWGTSDSDCEDSNWTRSRWHNRASSTYAYYVRTFMNAEHGLSYSKIISNDGYHYFYVGTDYHVHIGAKSSGAFGPQYFAPRDGERKEHTAWSATAKAVTPLSNEIEVYPGENLYAVSSDGKTITRISKSQSPSSGGSYYSS